MIIFWTTFLITTFVMAIVFFAIGETYALRHNKLTLSRYIYNANKAWPLLAFAVGLSVGLFVGGLSVHLFWHWCPELGSLNG